MDYPLDSGVSIQVAWPLAAREAAAAGFEEIGNAHLLLGLLKLAELSQEQLDRLAEGPQALPELKREQEEICRHLAERGLRIPGDTVGIRHTLRKSLGRGPSGEQRRGLHRSAAARESCRRAACAAQDQGEPCWRGVHLLAALLEQEDKLIQGTLLAAGRGLRDREAPLLAHEPALKVLAQFMCGRPARAVALLRKDGPHPERLMRALPGYLAQGLHGGQAVVKEVVELDLTALEASELEAALQQAAQAGGGIVFLRGLARLLEDQAGQPPAPPLAACLRQSPAPLVADLDGTLWEALPGSSPWRQGLTPIWLHRVTMPEML
ncbi:MAG: hypothetical protein HY794_12940 [Desulfarculus sp.]|nr:hypothetical protein [Desulfarculus sp.]